MQKDIDDVLSLEKNLGDLSEMFELSLAESVDDLLAEITEQTTQLHKAVTALNFRRLFSGEHDASDAFLTVQAGSGGTEAQDWAAMLYRMYYRYAEDKKYSIQVMEEMPGEVVGIKSATLKISGSYAYGYLRLETGIHRLVRKSPFDANHKRHTSFASAFVFPVVDESFEVNIDVKDLRIDTYRSSGAGGQHVNTTDSAVRIIHLPTGITVQCQNDRSQHKNKATAMAMLKAKLLQSELNERNAEKNKLEEQKDDIGWGRQIRSYVLDQSRIKDLRTGFESGNTRGVLDGDLDGFIRAELLMDAAQQKDV